MSRLLLVVLAAALATSLLVANPARAQGPAPDSLGAFFQGLADSTDASYGTQSVTFDTTGLDSLASGALTRPPRIHRRGGGLGLSPLLGYHRAEGAIVGMSGRVGSRAAGWLSLAGTYGFGNRQGRYAFGYRRTLLYRGARRGRLLAEPGRIVEGATRIDLDLGYARSSQPFLPEHATPRLGNFDALFSGKSSSSLYEQRGASGGLTFWTGDWRLVAGVRHWLDQPMPLVTRYTLLADREGVPVNRLALDDEYTEPFGSLGFWRGDWELGALLEARGGGADRWRMRGALGKALRLGSSIKAYAQFEAGATAANAPLQRRFGLGGPRAVPSLPIETGATDHLLLGRVELIEAHDVLEAVGLPHPDWLVLQPLVLFHAGAAWDDAGGRDIVFAGPPSNAWRGSAGAGLALKLGVPDPETLARIYVAWPVGPDAGKTTFRFTLGTTFELLGRL